MGMYTTIIESDVGVADMEGLKKWLAEMKANKRPEYINNEKGYTDTGQNRGPTYAGMVKVYEDERKVDFNGMDGWKIIGYWYPLFCQFLRDIAVFLEDGYIEMEYENNELYAQVEFCNGECIIHTGSMQFHEPCNITEWSANKMSEDLEKQLVARRI